MSEFTRTVTLPKRLAALLLVSLVAVLLSSCGREPPVEQIRQRHDDTMGHPVKITYEIGSDWQSEKWGRYSPVGIEADDVSLYVDVDSARVKGDDFAARLAELKKGPNNGRKRERITAKIITLDERPAIEFAMRQESSRVLNTHFVAHRFEFIRGDFYITVKLSTRDEHYDRFVDQLLHTAQSIQLDPGE